MKAFTMIVIVFIAAACILIVPSMFPVSSPAPTPQTQFQIPPSSWANSLFGVEREFNISDGKDRNMTWEPHYVTFHIHPEKEGVDVTAWASDSLPPESGYTDNKSEVTLQLLSSARYNINVGDKCKNYYIYPTGNYYELECNL